MKSVISLTDYELVNRLRMRVSEFQNQECLEALIFEALARLLVAKADNEGSE